MLQVTPCWTVAIPFSNYQPFYRDLNHRQPNGYAGLFEIMHLKHSKFEQNYCYLVENDRNIVNLLTMGDVLVTDNRQCKQTCVSFNIS